MPNLKWGITQPDAIIKDVEHVLYRISSYKTADGGNVFVTHRFYVKLKHEDDLSLLLNTAKQCSADIEEIDEDIPLWYILRCKLPASKNALELANIFYESGFFAVAEPEFMGNISTCIYNTGLEKQTNIQSVKAKKVLNNGIFTIECGGKIYNAQGAEILR